VGKEASACGPSVAGVPVAALRPGSPHSTGGLACGLLGAPREGVGRAEGPELGGGLALRHIAIMKNKVISCIVHVRAAIELGEYGAPYRGVSVGLGIHPRKQADIAAARHGLPQADGCCC